jgi:hypothetical protein
MTTGALFVEPIEITGDLLVSTNVDGSLDPAAWDVAHTYGAGDQATVGDAIYQSMQAANTGHDVTLVEDPPWWVRVGAINALRMFDHRIGAQTENAESIEVVISPGQIIDLVSLRNVQALTVRLQQTSPSVEGVVYDKTISLDDPVADWFEYFFSPVTFRTDALFPGLLPITDSLFSLFARYPAGTAKIGELIMGPALDAGIAEAGVQDGIDDYSTITADEFGVRDIVERDFADNMEATVWVQAARSGTLRRLLTANRARPILFIPVTLRADAQVYGLAESWRRTLSYPGMDVFSITMKGLT